MYLIKYLHWQEIVMILFGSEEEVKQYKFEPFNISIHFQYINFTMTVFVGKCIEREKAPQKM